ncbi:fliR [Wigglesworthia glossinidia endosymbiont of Glossina brevipalpis]|uniref:Flagellar biosynthetic protein FliR n=1 Tax=Wigglesworthia glossinidia brevipalpis TaxID=36870 RepID=Q8D3F3_WIGBR|nr:fliR [Wigglesworthia glossinidia endosymbiont of Glossina brevipalpis]
MSMIDFSINILLDWINQNIWAIARVNGLFISAPVFNEKVIPRKIKILISVLFSFLVSQELPLNNISIISIEGFYVLIIQIIIGFFIGLILQLSFCSIKFSGELIGLQMGLSFAVFFDHISGPNSPIISRFFNLILILIFLSFDAHLTVLDILFNSFKLIPIGINFKFNDEIFFSIINFSGIIFANGLFLSIPSITMLLSLNILFGILNRFTPQFSIFVIGFSLTLLIGLLSIYIILNNFQKLSTDLIFNTFKYIYNFF